VNWEYVVGFFDAEGSVYFKKLLTNDGYIRRVAQLQLVNTNKKVLEKIKDFLKAGHIYTYINYDHFGKKPIYRFYIYKKQDLRRIFKEFLKHSFVKREKIIGLLNFLGDEASLLKPSLNWSYIAGFFDGEGTIYQDGKTGYWKLSISNSNKEILKKIRSFIKSGNIYIEKRSKNPVYRFHLNDQRFILKFVENILVFSTVKKEMLKKALNSIKTKEWHSNYKLKNITREKLYDLYFNKRLSLRKIAEELGVTYNSIWFWFKKFNIPRRSVSEAIKLTKSN